MRTAKNHSKICLVGPCGRLRTVRLKKIPADVSGDFVYWIFYDFFSRSLMTIRTSTGSSKTELSSRGKRPFKVWWYQCFFCPPPDSPELAWPLFAGRDNNIAAHHRGKQIELANSNFFRKLWTAISSSLMAFKWASSRFTLIRHRQLLD